jgi:hypothetical protein
MVFYSPTDRQFNRHHLEEMELAFSAIDCVLNGQHAIYASTELTSGFRVFGAFRDAKVRTTDELKQKMGKDWYSRNIWDANVALAVAFAESVRERATGTPVITPAPFMAPGWSQFEYLAFWEKLLRTRIKSSWLNDNWEYSNGCTFEFAVAHDAGVPTCDRRGNSLSLDDGVRLIREAIRTVEAGGFDAAKLRENLDKLVVRTSI